MRRVDQKGQPRRRQRRRLRFFRPLVIECFEERQLLTSGLFYVQLDGLPDTSDDDRIAAATARFQAAGLTPSQVQAIAVVDPRESVLVRTPLNTTLPAVVQELRPVIGFVDVDPYDPGASEEEEEEEEAGDGGDQTVSLTGNEPTIAVNPGNVNNIIIAQAARLRISTDGGVTFPISVTRPLPSGQTSSAGDDSLAFDAQNRLLWSYLTHDSSGGLNVAAVQVNPTTGAIVGSATLIASGDLDKEWIAADRNAASPFANRVYAVWNDFGQSSNAPVRFARSVDQGVTWTALSGNLSGSGEGFTWPPEVAVGPNGDVWAAWHVNGSVATTGGTRLRRSTDGGVTFGSELVPFPDGTSAATYNVNAPRLSGFSAWLQGSPQPRILIDPTRTNTLYVISVDDPDGTYTATGDASDIVIARSTDNGATWTRSTVSHGPTGTLQIMPAAAIDAAGNVTVTWYDNRRGLTNAIGDYLLDVYAATSIDGGLTFGSDTQINTAPFDPDLGAPDRFPPSGVWRIGEYNGLVSTGGTGYAVWTGNTQTGQQTIFAKFSTATAFRVNDSTPASGQVVTAPPTQFVIQLNDRLATASVQASDLSVNGLPADSFTINGTGDAITFKYNVSPVTVEGPQSMAIAAAALARNTDGAASLAYAGSFFYDPLPLSVVSTSPAVNGVLSLPAPLTLDVNFNEPVDPNSVQMNDMTVSGVIGAAVSGVTVINNNSTARFTISGIASEGLLTATIGAGAISDPAGVPLTSGVPPLLSVGDAFVGTYQVDAIQTSLLLPVPDFALGSLAYETSASGIINFAGDSDVYTLSAEGGQTVTALVTADAPDLLPAVQVLNAAGAVIGSATAAVAGQSALLQTLAVATSGTYKFNVTAATGTTGNYTLHVYLNATLESSDWGIGANNTRQTAQNLDAAFISLVPGGPNSSRAVVIGSISGSSATLSAADSGWWNDQGLHTSSNKNYYVGQDSGGLVHDYFVFDVSAVRQPITAATLTLSNPSYVSPDASETFNLFDVSSPVAAVEDSGPGQSTAIFDDLGTGTILANKVVTSSSPVTIDLNANGLSYANAHRGVALALGGALSSISGSSNQWIFGSSGTSSTRQLSLTLANTDFYSVTLAAGQLATVGLNFLAGSGSIALQNSAGATVATGVVGAGGANLHLVINNFTAPVAGTYYVVITGTASSSYGLVITRDATFDIEPNDSLATAQALTGGSVLGNIAASSPQFIVPSVLATTEGNGNNGYPFNLATDGTTSMRYQQLYSAAEFNQAGAITAIRFRRNGGAAVFTASGIDCKINLGYAATSFASPSTTFADNVGAGMTTVFDGLLSLSSNAAVATPEPFDVVISLTRPFFYQPGRGDLLLDVFMRNLSTTRQFDLSDSGQQTTTRRLYSHSLTATTGTIDSTFSGLVTRFDMAPVDEDWYSIAVTDTSIRLNVSTATPGSGVSQLNTLNPRIELYDPTGALVASGTALADSRNEKILYQPLTIGVYHVRVRAEGLTQGDYIVGTNQSPTASDLSFSTLEDTSLPVLLVASDLENDPLTFAVIAQPLHGTMSGTGPNRTYMPAQNYFGPDLFTYQASDGQLSSRVATVSLMVIPVNDAPLALPDNGIVPEDSPAGVLIDVLANDSPGPANESDQTIAFILGLLPAHGTVTLENGKIRYLPTEANYNGPDSFTYTVTDNGTTLGNPDPQSSSGAVTITISEVNDPPVPGPDMATLAEDSPGGALIDVLFNDSPGPANESGQNLSITFAAAAHGAVTVENGKVRYVPAADYNGEDSITYTVTDDGTTGGNPNPKSTTGTVAITVAEVNDPPVPAADAAFVDEDSAVGVLIDVLANDHAGPANEAGQNLSIAPGTAAHGAISIENGKLRYVPTDANYNGADSFSYTLTDDGTTDGNSDPQSSVGTVTLTIMEVNDSPIAGSDAATIDEDSAVGVLIDVLANDSAGPADEAAQNLSITLGAAAHGTITVENGEVRYIPSEGNYNGADTFTYTITDNGTTSGAADPQIDIGTVTITVSEVNDPPLGINDSLIGVPEDSASGLLPFSVLLANDLTGPGNESSQHLTISSIDSVVGGTARIIGSSVIYKPNADFNGLFSFVYTLLDNGTTGGVNDFQTSHATASLLVTEVNDPPLGTGDFLSTLDEDSAPRAIPIATLLANDNKGPANESGQTLTITALSSVIGGDASIVGSDILFTPAPDFNGQASFVYTVADDGATNGQPDPKTSKATVNFTINAVNDPPTFVKGADQQVTDEGGALASTITFDGLSSDTFDSLHPYMENGFQVKPLSDTWLPVFGCLPGIASDICGNPSPAIMGGGIVELSRLGNRFRFSSLELGPAHGGPVGLPETIRYTFIGLLSGHVIFKTSGQETTSGLGMVNNLSGALIDTLRVSVTALIDNIRLTVPTQQIDHWTTNIAPGPMTATDEAGQHQAFSITNDNPDIFIDQPTIDLAGKLSFTPKPNTAGTAHVSVVLMDDGGTAHGGVDASDMQTFDIVVTKAHVWHNTIDRLDVNADGHVVAADPLAVINFINAFDSQAVPTDGRATGPYVDVNGDGFVAANDALDIINQINAFGPDGEGEPTIADDDLFLLLAYDLAVQPKRRSAL